MLFVLLPISFFILALVILETTSLTSTKRHDFVVNDCVNKQKRQVNSKQFSGINFVIVHKS